MIVTDIEANTAKRCELKAKVETSPEGSSELFYRLPDEFTQSIHVSADPFIAALLILSMRLGETLTVDAPASPRLLRALPKIMAYYHNWDPKYKIIDVRTAKGRQESDSTSRANALFFSGGVDSFYALTRLTEQTADRNHLSHLIFVHGFDIRLNNNMLFEKSYAAVKDVASYYGKKLVLVSTNVREITDKYVSWYRCYGNGMASVALCGLFRNVYIASDVGPNERYLAFTSAHPDLDSLWSTDTTALIHYGEGISRVEKAKALANNPMAQKHLRVCMENRNGAYNCGRCSKCVRTMLALYMVGALSNFNFPTELTPELVKAINYSPDPSIILHTEQILHELQRRGEDQLANALSQALNKDLSYEKEIDALRSELMGIKKCFGYKVMRLYGSVIDQALPDGTRRGELKRRVLHRLRGSS